MARRASSRGASPSVTPVAPASTEGSHSKVEKVKRTHKDVYVFIPNLIGYARVLLTIVGIFLLYRAGSDASRRGEWIYGLVSYSMSFVLDFFDGYAARHFKQTSNMGAVLDMVTDRVSTMLLLFVLGAKLDPEYFYGYAFLAGLDYSSHWVQMYASKGHHKTSNEKKNAIVRFFYGNYPFFGFACAGTEFFYICRSAQFFVAHPVLDGLTQVLFTAMVSKNIVNVAQLMSGFEAVAKADVGED